MDPKHTIHRLPAPPPTMTTTTTTMPAPPPASLTERIKQLSWTRVNRRATKATRDPTRDASYKEKLRTFRRTTPGATAD
ncbi:unnamed protein product [Knipowitschia caucasica]